jgi:hypothetical protein
MGKAPANTDKKMSVSDVVLARSYVADIGGAGKVKSILHNAYSRLTRMFPHNDRPALQWTERRVRSFWHQEAAYVEFREMRELHAAAAKAKEERELLKKARKEHAAFIEKTASLRALLERQDEDFHCHQIEGLGAGTGGMDLPGNRD